MKTDFEKICDAIRDYLQELPTEGGRGHRDSWLDRLDNALADIRAALASSPETARDRAERRVAELHAAGIRTLGDIERAQSSGELRKKLEAAWTDFCDANPDDLTSPDDLPDHALMTCRQFVDYAISALSRPQADDGWRPTGHVSIAHDGFAGDIIGHYETREGKRGVAVQQDGTRVVHVYGEKWLFASAPATGGE